MVLRWGLASAGLISHDFACAISTLDPAQHMIVAVAARQEEKAAEFAKLHEIPKSYGDYKLMAADPEIDIVYVGTVNPYHLDVSKLMLEHGKHVLCEKPLCLNYRQTKELVDYAAAKGLFLMEAIWSRFFPVYEQLQRVLQRGDIGEVLHLHVSFGFSLTSERLSLKSLGGGTVLDLGIYTLQLAQLVFGNQQQQQPTKLAAVGHLNAHGTDDAMSCVLTYAGGRTATLTTSRRLELSNEAVIYGTKGALKIPSFWCPTVLDTPTKEYEYPLPESKIKCNFKNSVGLRYEAESVRLCLEKGLKENPKVSHNDSLQLASLMDEIRRQIGVVFDGVD